MKEALMGVLGVGFLGKELLHSFDWPPLSWGTHHRSVSELPQNRFHSFAFQWENPESWDHLPKTPATLVLTIPPLFKDIQQEEARLNTWGHWMRKNRPQIQRLVYISTTGVYPAQNGVWEEDFVFVPESPSGKLRWMTEQILCQYFQTHIVRAGGIYGQGRNLITRVLAQKPISRVLQPTHRVHVTDLAGIVREIVLRPHHPTIVNAVDNEPLPSLELYQWLVQQQLLAPSAWFEPEEGGNELSKERHVEQREVLANKRFISNRRLLEEMKYVLRYPSYREGYQADV